MTQHRNHESKSGAKTSGVSFWKSRAGITLLAFFGAVGLLLAFEHRVHIFTSDGLLIALLGLCIVMHRFMHGGHGGGHCGSNGKVQ